MRFTTIPRSSKPEAVKAHAVETWRDFIDFLTDPENNNYYAKPLDLSPDAKKDQAPGFIGAFLDLKVGSACREAVRKIDFLHVDIDFYEEVATFVPSDNPHKAGRSKRHRSTNQARAASDEWPR